MEEKSEKENELRAGLAEHKSALLELEAARVNELIADESDTGMARHMEARVNVLRSRAEAQRIAADLARLGIYQQPMLCW